MNTHSYLTARFPAGGYFVEAGAHDGVGDSQTYLLEKAGWTGICVEPSRAYHGLRQSRTCAVDNRVLWSTTEEVVVWREMAGEAVELSGVVSAFGDHWDRDGREHKDKKRFTVSLTTLLEYWHAPHVIEFLSLDTEGSELEILRAHDFEKYRFLFAAVEHNGVAARRDAIATLLIAKGMTYLVDDGINLFMELL